MFGEDWFKNSEIESVVIPKSVKSIGTNAFYNCTYLKQVTFTSGSELEAIWSYCFFGTKIERIVIPKSVEEI